MTTAPTQPQALAQRAPQKVVMDLLAARMESFKAIATEYLPPERLLKCVGLALNKTPKLAQCTQGSLLQSVMTACQLGLDPSGTLGSAYLVPYGNTCQLIIGYRGMIDLCRRSGDVQSLQAWLVYKSDEFTIRAGTDNPGIDHRPSLTSVREEKDILGAYAVAKMRDGTTQFDWMSRPEIERIRQRSRSGNNGPWVTDFGEMAKKTVLRRLAKTLPISIEQAEKVQIATKADPTMAIIDIDADPSEPADERSGTERLAETLGVLQPAAPAPTPAPEPARPAAPPAPEPEEPAPQFDADGNLIEPAAPPTNVGTVDRSPPGSKATRGRR